MSSDRLDLLRALLAAGLLTTPACGATGFFAHGQGRAADDLPVTRVVLYQDGVGYFERRGEVDGDHLTIRVRRDQIADFLKSLTVVDLSRDGRAVAVALPVDKSADRQLAELPPQVREQGGILAMARAFRGARATVTTADGDETGRIVGVEQLTFPAKDAQTPGGTEWRLTLLVGGATLRSYRVQDIEAMKIDDPALAVGLDKALDVDLDQAAWKPIDLTVELAGKGPHQIVVSYVVEMPTWRPAYRVVVGKGGKALLQGWAVVDNVSGEDWDDVRLSLTAGTPLAFVYDLYTPHWVQRPDLTPPETEAANTPIPQAFGGEVGAGGAPAGNGESDEDGVADQTNAPMPAPAAPRAAMEKSYSPPGAEAAPAPPPPPPVTENDLERNYHTLVSGRGVGSLFRYDLAEPITVRDRESALVSVVSKQVPGDDALLFSTDNPGQNPYRAVKLANTTGLVLEHGPVAIYRDSTFLGEALAGRMEKGSTVFVPYALDSRVNIFLSEQESNQGATITTISGGVLTIATKTVSRYIYDVTNGTGGKATLWVQRAKETGWNLTNVALASGSPTSPPQPGVHGVIEEGDSYYVPIALPESGEVKLDVDAETPAVQTVSMTSDEGMKAIATYVETPGADPKVVAQLDKVVTMQRQIATVERHMNELSQQKEALSERENQERANLEMLGKSGANADLRKKLLAELASYDEKLAAIAGQYVSLSEQESQIKDQLATVVAGIKLD